MRGMTSVALLAVLGYLGMCAVLFVFQRSLIYLPQPYSPDAAGGGTEVLEVDGERVLVTVRPGKGPGAVIYFGGNAEIVPYTLPELAEAFPGRALYLAHYRGYAGSTGSPSEAALLADALALFDRVHASHADVTVVGRSLGSGVAAYLAGSRPVTRLVLVTPFDSLAEVAARHYPIFPVRLLLRDRYESRLYAPGIDAPTLLVAAGEDEIVPRSSTEALLASFRPGVARLVTIPGTSHNTISFSPEYARLLRGEP